MSNLFDGVAEDDQQTAPAAPNLFDGVDAAAAAPPAAENGDPSTFSETDGVANARRLAKLHGMPDSEIDKALASSLFDPKDYTRKALFSQPGSAEYAYGSTNPNGIAAFTGLMQAADIATSKAHSLLGDITGSQDLKNDAVLYKLSSYKKEADLSNISGREVGQKADPLSQQGLMQSMAPALALGGGLGAVPEALGRATSAAVPSAGAAILGAGTKLAASGAGLEAAEDPNPSGSLADAAGSEATAAASSLAFGGAGKIAAKSGAAILNAIVGSRTVPEAAANAAAAARAGADVPAAGLVPFGTGRGALVRAIAPLSPAEASESGQQVSSYLRKTAAGEADIAGVNNVEDLRAIANDPSNPKSGVAAATVKAVDSDDTLIGTMLRAARNETDFQQAAKGAQLYADASSTLAKYPALATQPLNVDATRTAFNDVLAKMGPTQTAVSADKPIITKLTETLQGLSNPAAPNTYARMSNTVGDLKELSKQYADSGHDTAAKNVADIISTLQGDIKNQTPPEVVAAGDAARDFWRENVKGPSKPDNPLSVFNDPTATTASIANKLIVPDGPQGTEGRQLAQRAFDHMSIKEIAATRQMFYDRADVAATQGGAFNVKAYTDFMRQHSGARDVYFKGRDLWANQGMQNLMETIQKGTVSSPSTAASMAEGQFGGQAATKLTEGKILPAVTLAGVAAMRAVPRWLVNTSAGRRLAVAASDLKVGSPAMQNILDSIPPAVYATTGPAGAQELQQRTSEGQ